MGQLCSRRDLYLSYYCWYLYEMQIYLMKGKVCLELNGFHVVSRSVQKLLNVYNLHIHVQ